MIKYAAIFTGLLLSLFFGGATLTATISTPYGDKIEAVIFDCDGVLVDTE